MNLSKNITLKELIKSESATRFGISNEPTEEIIFNLQNLVVNILQPIRDHYGLPLIITSGYRSPELCIKIGSSASSQHTKGQAADFEIDGVSNKKLSDFIHQNLDYDQLILEFWNPQDSNSGWVHCSYNGLRNRKQYLKAEKIDDKIIYSSL